MSTLTPPLGTSYAPAGGAGPGPYATIPLAVPWTGQPTVGYWTKGLVIIDQAGAIYICTTSGIPGTWVPNGTYAQIPTSGLFAARPNATTKGQQYLATDVSEGGLYVSLDGSTWTNAAAIGGKLFLRDYGAKGDGAHYQSGAMSSGTAALADTTNTPFTTSDIGKAITVIGAGTSGADLQTTISGFTDSGHVTLAANAGTTVTGAEYGYGTDDTSAISSFFSALLTTGETYGTAIGVCDGKKYVLAGPIVAGSNGQYAQVPLPTSRSETGPDVCLTIKGLERPQPRLHFAANSTEGTIFLSLRRTQAASAATGLPSMFGGLASYGPTSAGSYTDENYVSYRWSDITFRQLPNPVLTALDMGFTNSLQVTRCQADITTPGFAQVVPSSPTAIGIVWPSMVNRGPVSCSEWYAHGYFCGDSLGENLDASDGRIESMFCYLAHAVTPLFHCNEISTYMDTNCVYGIAGLNPYAASAAAAVIAPSTTIWPAAGIYGGAIKGHLDFQNNNSQPGVPTGFNRQYHVVDTGGTLNGDCTVRVVNAGGPNPGSLSNNNPAAPGSTDFRMIMQDSGRGPVTAPAIPANGVPLRNMNWRDAIVYITPNSLSTVAVGSTTLPYASPTSVIAVSLPSGKCITLNYTGTAPTWAWVQT